MKKNKFSLTVIKIFMKNQIQNKSYILLDIFNMISRCLVLFLLYDYIFSLKDGNINGTSYETTLWSMFIYFCLMTLNLRKIYKLIMDDVKKCPFSIEEIIFELYEDNRAKEPKDRVEYVLEDGEYKLNL